MSGYTYCVGCNTNYVDTDCGQDREHIGCPRPCSICGKLLDGRETPQSCPGHTRAEADAFLAAVRARGAGGPTSP